MLDGPIVNGSGSAPACVPRLRAVSLDAAWASAMCAIEHACFSMPWSEAQCRAAFAQPAFVALGLVRGQRLAAYISLYAAGAVRADAAAVSQAYTPDAELEILNLAVMPGERRQGHGRRLLLLALQAGRKMGMHKALLEVREGNTPAIALYTGCGFVRIGRRRRYYADTGEDALVLSRGLARQSHALP